jgi:flagellar hook assembly protein FlgD
MFVTAVSSVTLAVFTNLSIMELGNTRLNLSSDSTREAQATAAPAAVSEPVQGAGESVQHNQGDATAAVWASDAVEQHRLRD